MGNRRIINQLGYRYLRQFMASCNVYHVEDKNKKIERIMKISNDGWAEEHIKRENYALKRLEDIKHISKKIKFYGFLELNSILSYSQKKFIEKKSFEFCVLIKEFILNKFNYKLNNNGRKILENTVKEIHKQKLAGLDLNQWLDCENFVVDSIGEPYIIDLGCLVKKEDVSNSKFQEYIQKDLKNLEIIFKIYGV